MPSRRHYNDSRTASREVGRVALIRPLSFAVMTVSALVVALALLLYASLGEYTRRTSLTGLLAPDDTTVSVSSAGPGRVAQRLVREGQSVKAGDVMVVLAPLPTTSPAVASKGTDNADNDPVQIAERLRRAKSKVRTADEQLQTAQRRLSAARNDLARARQMSGGTMSEAVQRQLDQVLNSRTHLQSTEKAQARANQDVTAAQAQLDTISPKAAVVTAAAKPAEAQQVMVRAPVAGTVKSIKVEPGMTVSHEVLVLLTPDNAPLEARVYVPAGQVASIQRGQAVRLRYRALPGAASVLNDGTVIDVARQPAPDHEVPRGLASSSDATSAVMHLVRVSLASQGVAVGGQTLALQSGLRVDADILQGTRRLLEWAFESRHPSKGSS
jgi:membrane fusion protein